MSKTPEQPIFDFDDGHDAPVVEEVVTEVGEVDAVVEVADGDEVVEVSADGVVAEVEEVASADEPEEEEGPPEPGLSSAGQYLCASSIAFWVAAVAVMVSFLHFGEFPMHVGLAIIVLPIFLLCVVTSIIGFLAKPKKKEKLFLLFTLGPLGPLAGAVVFGMAFFKAFSGG